jgi:hypothetical protein
MKILGGELDRIDGVHHIAVVGEDNREVRSVSVVGKDDHSLAFVDTKKLLDSTGVGQN